MTTSAALPIPVSLRRLFPSASFVGCGDIVAVQATSDSRKAGADILFAALPGTRVNGADFATDAVQRGCRAILTGQPLPQVKVAQCIVPDVQSAWARLCDALFGYPSRRLRICGVTGTNGKTTVAWMMRSVLRATGCRCGLAGTIEYSDGVDSEPASLTTPDARELSHLFGRMVERGATDAVIELSSHALHQNRTSGTPLSSAIITNITQDHFDYHESFQDYVAAKSRILSYVSVDGVVVINADDPGAASLIDVARGTGRRVVTTGIESRADVRAIVRSESLNGSQFEVELNGRVASFETRLPGRHNIANCLSVLAAATHYGIAPETVRAGVLALECVPGRLERVDCGQPFQVFVDYAHTDDALRRVINSLKTLATDGQVLCVFGAGGDRDVAKRPLLAEAASHADVAIVTSDNPRSEAPNAIIEDILAGFPAGFTSFHVELDRRRAIDRALAEAGPGDCVLIAGKGHEAVQIVGTERLPFDDRQVAAELIQARLPNWQRQATPQQSGP